MTNKERFIKVMNDNFDARLTEENFQKVDDDGCSCTPCGVYRKGACDMFNCHGCANWWEEEWKPKKGANVVLPIPCTKIERETIKDWFQKINRELDKLEGVILRDAEDKLDTEMLFYFATDKNEIAEKAADTITAITSMLEAMGIDEEMRQETQRRVNEKNKERGRF